MKKIVLKTVSVVMTVLMLLPMLLPVAAVALTSENVSYYDGTYSTKWYDDNPTPANKEFHLKSAADLAGYVYLVNTKFGGASFGGYTIKLDCNVVWNTGNAEDWLEKAPKYSWTPISISQAHYSSGGFDGQGHYISGLYQNDNGSNHTGFIGVHGGSDLGLKNLAIVNSFFAKNSASASQNSNYGVGVFMSTPYNTFTFENLYTDAIVMDKSNYTGGIVGSLRSSGATAKFKNCVFAGTIIGGGEHVGGIVSSNCAGTVQITDCINLGSVYGKKYVGGIIGSTTSSAAKSVSLTNCINAGPVGSVNGAENGAVSAIIGENSATHFTPVMKNCLMVDVSSQTASRGNAVSAGAASVKAKDIFNNASFDLSSLDSEGAFKASWTNHSESYPLPKSISSMLTSLGITLPLDYNGVFNGNSSLDVTDYDSSAPVIEISSAEDLERIVFLNGYFGASFAGQTLKLTNDIVFNSGNAADWAENPPEKVWTPINNFQGTFDGDGHIISGLCYNGTQSIGMFNSINNATVKNFILTNSYFETTADVLGGVVASAQGNKSRVENVYCDTIIRAKGHHNGGIVGILGGAYMEIDSCVYAGSIYADKRYTGGILGNTSFNQIKITNCLNLGSVAALDEMGGIVGIGGNTTGDLVANCINAGYVSSTSASSNGDVPSWFMNNDGELANGGIYGTIKGSASAAGTYKVTMDDCWLVSDFTTNKISVKYEHPITGEEKLITLGELWGIDPKELDTDESFDDKLSFAESWSKTESYPLPKGIAVMLEKSGFEIALDPDGKTVQPLDMTWKRDYGTKIYLKSASQMESFSKASAQDKLTWSGKTIVLSNDVTLSDDNGYKASWTPLGDFAGTFDGQNNIIYSMVIDLEGANAAMFESVNGAVIKNLSLENIKVNSNTNASGLVWWMKGASVIDNVIVSGDISGQSAGVAGIVGIAANSAVINACLVEGSINGSSNVGGIAGNCGSYKVTVTNCFNMAKITGTGDSVGGIVGFAGDGAATNVKISDCLSIGKVVSASGKKQGALVGNYKSGAGVMLITDSAALEGTSSKLVGTLDKVDGAIFAKDSELKGFDILNKVDLTGWQIVYDWYPLPTDMSAEHHTLLLATLVAEEKEGMEIAGWKGGEFFLPDGFSFRYRTSAPENISSDSFEAVYVSITTDEAVVRLSEPQGLGFFTSIDAQSMDLLSELDAVYKIGTVIAPTDYTENGVGFSLEALQSAYGEKGYLDVEKDDGWYNAKTVNTDGFYLYRGSIVNIKKANADRPFSGTGYIALKYSDGSVRYFYGAKEAKFNNSTLYLASKQALEEDNVAQAEKEIYQKLMEKGTAKSTRFIAQYKDNFKVNGRTSALSEGITVDWSGSSIEFVLDCSGDVTVSAIGSYATSLGSGNTEFTVYVDGVQHGTFSVYNGYNKDIVVARGLSKGVHTIRLSKWAHAESAQVEFTKLGFTGELLDRPKDSDIFIEIIGDSISCGYGNNNGNNDGNLSYGYIAADILDADYSIFARSGLWLVNAGTAAIPDLYPYVSWYRDGGKPGGELYDFENCRIPDVVVINLGTNDYNGNAGAAKFAAAMKDFVATIRENYGNGVPIIWAYGMMNNGYKDTIISVVEELGGSAKNNYALGFEQNNTGAGSHPDTAHQKQYGEELAAYIKELLK